MYSAGLVSGSAVHTSARPATVTAAIDANPTQCDAGQRADHALRQVEAAGAGREVGDHQDRQHRDDRAGHAVEQLDEDHDPGLADHREQERARSLGAEADEQQRLASPELGPIADPRRQDRDDDLRHDDQSGHEQRAERKLAQRQILADQRQHRSVGKLEQHHCAGEQQQIPVLAQIGDPLHLERAIAHGGIAGAHVVDLVRPDPIERDQRGNAQQRGDHEYRAHRRIDAQRSHGERGDGIAGRGEPKVSTDAA